MTMPAQDPLESLRREAPYIAAVVFLILFTASMLLPLGPRAAEAEAAPAAEPRLSLWLVGALGAVLAAGLGVLAFCGWRVLRGRPVLAAVAAPAPRWSLWDVLKLFAVYAVLPNLFAAAVAGVLGLQRDGSQFAFLLMQPLAAVATAAVVMRVILFDRGAPRASLGLVAGRRGAMIGVLACLGFLPVYALLAFLQGWLAQRYGVRLRPQAPVLVLLTSKDWLLVGVVLVHAAIVAPAIEELLFRGVLLPVLLRHMRPWVAIAASAAFFSACHSGVQVVLPIFLLGLALGFIYHRTRSLPAAVAFHAAYNTLTVLAVLGQRFSG